MAAFAARSVKSSEDLARIVDLPRRKVLAEEADALVDEWTGLLATAAGKRAGVRLLRWQAYALREAYEQRGLYAALPVGQGKTLITYLLATVLDARRPLLVLPSALEDQTRDSFAHFSRLWQMPAVPPDIKSTEVLGQPQNDNMIRGVMQANGRRCGLRPDLVIIDEADTLRNPKAAVVKRLDRWYSEAEDDCMWAILTGTPGRLSILDFSHHLIWALKDRAPVPLRRSECETWAAAIDEKASRFGKRPGVGELRQLFVPGDSGTLLDQARRGFLKRVTETPGVLIVDEDSTGGLPLLVRQIKPPEDPILDTHFETFRVEGVTPDGRALAGPLDRYRHEGAMSTGMFKCWDPHPSTTPEGRIWLEKRNQWWRVADEICEESEDWEDPLDTEGAAAQAFPDHPDLLAWLAVKDSFIPNSVTQWLSDSVVWFVLAWAREAPGLIWCWNPDFAEALETVSDQDGGPHLKLYSKNGKTRDGEFIGKASGKESAILTVGSNLRGRNLQMFSRNGVVNPPQSGRYLEQLFGRTHRRGARAGVTVDMFITSGGVADSFEAACGEGVFGKSTFGLTQKMLRAEIQRVSLPLATDDFGFRWARKVRRRAESEDDTED
jgi:hypothetical protein